MNQNHLPLFVEKMEKAELPTVVINTFSHYYEKVVTGDTGMICDRDIEPVAPADIPTFDQLHDYADIGRQFYRSAVRITLNGGLGTSMGLTGAKSLLTVKGGKSFLDYIVDQAGRNDVNLAFMNSFNTQAETLAALSGKKLKNMPLSFMQHKYPKILRDSLKPSIWPRRPEFEWNPPGHGDVYLALYTSGMLQDLLDRGIQYAFISNSDNLGANMDASLLGYFADKKLPFMMEVARKTPADVKGGHLARNTEGRLILRESAQCPDAEIESFQDIERYRYFNTNNIWVNLRFLKEMIDEQHAIYLPMIVNPKTLDPRDAASPQVVQVETAMGAAISLFEGAEAVRVPRARFFPVKKCSDLLAVRSDLFVDSEAGTLMLNPLRSENRLPDTLKIVLDPRYYSHIDQCDRRFKDGVPSLVNCTGLTIKGDVSFGQNTALVGRISITNRNEKPVHIESGTVIDSDLVYD